VGRDCIQKVSSADHDYVTEGFYAASPADEKKCPDLEVNVLLTIDDVTAKVKEGEKPDDGTAAVNQARKASMARIEKECVAKSGNVVMWSLCIRAAVTTFTSTRSTRMCGWSSRQRNRLRHSEATPTISPIPAIAWISRCFAAYENDRPVEPKDYLQWSRTDSKNGELIFVAGNPGTTGA